VTFTGDDRLDKSLVFRRKLFLSLILLAFWVILTAAVALYNLVLGAVVSALVAAISLLILARVLDPRISLLVIIKLPLFVLVLVWEIIKANIDVALIILSPRLPIDPGITEYKTFMPDDFTRTLFADAVTLTPGTITVDMEDDLLTVHYLAPRHLETIFAREKLVAWLFAVKPSG